MITIVNASVYSSNGNMVYAITYSEGSQVRTVESEDKMIRTECFIGGEWVATQKPYIVNHSKKRNAERIKASVIKFLAK